VRKYVGINEPTTNDNYHCQNDWECGHSHRMELIWNQVEKIYKVVILNRYFIFCFTTFCFKFIFHDLISVCTLLWIAIWKCNVTMVVDNLLIFVCSAEKELKSDVFFWWHLKIKSIPCPWKVTLETVFSNNVVDLVVTVFHQPLLPITVHSVRTKTCSWTPLAL